MGRDDKRFRENTIRLGDVDSINQLTLAQSVNGITGRHLFRTCRNAFMAIQCLELLYVTLFAWILGNNALH